MRTPGSTTLVRIVNGVLEMGWLFIIVAVPVFFNVRDYRTFEPDKIVLLRNTLAVMVALFLLKAVYVAPYYLRRWSTVAEGDQSVSFWSALQSALRRRPIVVAALVFGFIYILATINSIDPAISFWGSYDRMEGTYTYLCYITLFLLVLSHVRTWSQFERIATAVIFASVPVAAYSWLQHFSMDPLPWASGSNVRTPSTLGNPIFEAAALLMAVPFTLYRLVLGFSWFRSLDSWPRWLSSPNQPWSGLGVLGYVAALVLQLGAIGFSVSRGPELGFLAAVLVFVFVIALRLWLVRLLQIGLAAAVVLALVFGLANTVYKNADPNSQGFARFLHLLPSESGSSEVRSLLWTSAPDVLKDHLILGCGPEVLLFCWYPDYPTGLRSVELANAAPDRSHDEEIDIALTSGVLGELAYLAFLGSTILVLVRLVRRSTDLRSLTFASALLAAFVGHIVEGSTGIALSATLMLLWILAALATALDVGGADDVAAVYAGAIEPRPIAEAASTPGAASASQRAGRSQRQGAQTPARSRREQQRYQAAQSSRRARDRVSGYMFSAALAELGSRAKAIVAAAGVVAVIVIGLCGAVFVANTQLILADVSYRQGTNWEGAAETAMQEVGTQAAANYQCAQSWAVDDECFQMAISNYQDAVNTTPTWIGQPPQDSAYYLFLGKTYLSYATALKADKSHTNADVQAQLQNGLNVFLAAAKANPLNPDHPRNTAKLYLVWYQLLSPSNDVSKLELADRYFAKAHALAPHNSDIMVEWASLNKTIADNDPALAHQQYALALQHLQLALTLFPGSGSANLELGYVYGQYATWATAAHQTKEALHYADLQKQAWLAALPSAPTNYQEIYAPLSVLFYNTYHDYCDAGTYAQLALSANPSGPNTTELQQLIAVARSRGCKV